MTFRFIELQAFTEEVVRVADEESLREFQMELAANPESGALIQQSGGLRKARFRLPGRGKSGGARVVYLWLPNRGIFVLFMLYTKSARANISAAQLSRLRSAVESIKTQYNR
jgi:hypothetical protein